MSDYHPKPKTASGKEAPGHREPGKTPDSETRPAADQVPTVDAYPAVSRSTGERQANEAIPAQRRPAAASRDQVALELILPDGKHIVAIGHSAWPPRRGMLTVELAAAPTNPAPLLAALAQHGYRRGEKPNDKASPPTAPHGARTPVRAGTVPDAPVPGAQVPSAQVPSAQVPAPSVPPHLQRQSRVRRGGAAATQLQQAAPRGHSAPSIASPEAQLRANRPTDPVSLTPIIERTRRRTPPPLLEPLVDRARGMPSRATSREDATETSELPHVGLPQQPREPRDEATANVEPVVANDRGKDRPAPSTPEREAGLLGEGTRRPRTRAKTIEVSSHPPTHTFAPADTTPPRATSGESAGHPVGIDFGSSYCRLGVFRGGLELISDTDERLHMPACIPPPLDNVAADSARHDACSGLPTDSVRWLFGLGAEAPAALAASGGPSADLSPNGSVLLELGDGVVSVTDLCTALLRTLRQQAARHLATSVHQIVLTIPASWGLDQRHALETCARAAGLTQVTFIADPIAALIGHGLRGRKGLVAVYNLGGSFEFSLLESFESTFRVICAGSDPWVGGRELDAALAQMLSTSFGSKLHDGVLAGIDPRPALVRAAERAKRALSGAESVDVRFPLAGGDAVRATITRKQLERAAMPLLERSLVLAEQVLEQAGVKSRDVDEIVLTGGCALIPLVRRVVTKHFGHSPRVGDADLTVVRGAALRAAELVGTSAAHQSVRRPSTAARQKLQVQVEGGSTQTICEQGTPLPVNTHIGLQTTRDGQTELTLVLRAVEPDTDQTRLLARLRYTGLPAAPAGALKLNATFWAEDRDEVNITVTMGTRLFRSAVRLVDDASGTPGA